jgi:hypothetical protein
MGFVTIIDWELFQEIFRNIPTNITEPDERTNIVGLLRKTVMRLQSK